MYNPMFDTFAPVVLSKAVAPKFIDGQLVMVSSLLVGPLRYPAVVEPATTIDDAGWYWVTVMGELFYVPEASLTAIEEIRASEVEVSNILFDIDGAILTITEVTATTLRSIRQSDGWKCVSQIYRNSMVYRIL
jgi:hypothetical protein